jgi:pimeloyl-ACP methyl ester carboxylesterase
LDERGDGGGVSERVVAMGETPQRVGILAHQASLPLRTPAVVLLNAGLLHHVGPSRLYVEMSRRLAMLGFPVLRFDYSGIGDSPARRDDRSFLTAAIDETREAMDWLSAWQSLDRFVLMGVCSGATFGFRTARIDPRVAGVVMINPQGHLHDETDTALTQDLRQRTLARHYRRIAWRSSFRRKVWLRGLTGAVDYRSVLKLLQRQPRSGPPAEVADVAYRAGLDAARLREVLSRDVRLLEIHAEADEGLDYVGMLPGGLDGMSALQGLTFEIVRGANHSFTLLWSQQRLLESVLSWMSRTFPAPGA